MCIGYFGGFCGVHYYILHVVILVVVIDVRGSMKLVKSKEFVLFLPWRRLEAGSNVTINEIS